MQEGSCFNDPNHVKEKVFDGDPLTFFDAPTGSGAWVGMDFGKEVNIGKLIFIPRTDGNMIQLGDTYELYWWGPDWRTPNSQGCRSGVSGSFECALLA